MLSLLVTILVFIECGGFGFRIWSFRSHRTNNKFQLQSASHLPQYSEGKLEATFEDMTIWASILNNVTTHMESNRPENALTEVSQKMGFLFSRDIPK